MSKSVSPKTLQAKALTPAKYTKLFGSAPVLTSEHLSEYETMLMALQECIKPQDFILQMYVKDLADVTWEIRRYELHKTLVIEREHQRQQEIETKRRQQARRLQDERAERIRQRKEKEAEQADQAKQTEHATDAQTQWERAVELDAAVSEAPADIHEILHEPADEIDHAKALQSGIDYYERLDRLVSVARARRDGILQQIDFYSQGLGLVSRRASD